MFLELNQIKKSFGSGENRVQVLKGIDLAVEKGEFCVLLGGSHIHLIIHELPFLLSRLILRHQPYRIYLRIR